MVTVKTGERGCAVKTLMIVDVQNDFLPGGALAVPEGDRVVPVANRLMRWAGLVIATQDWHPPDHGSFAPNHPGKKPGDEINLNGLSQILWPPHCVQNTPGAELAPGLDTSRIRHRVTKGTDPGIDSYSAFFDNGHRKDTGLDALLRSEGASELYIMGLATDYCVKYTALDARRLGWPTVLVLDGCRGIELQPGDIERAVQAMRKAGVTIRGSDEWTEQ